jgi:glycosyltransferase involved in cell wall biosynthesis
LAVTPGEDILIADSPARFAAQVLRLFGDPDLRVGLSANARRLVEREYDWSAIGQRFADLVEAAALERPAS